MRTTVDIDISVLHALKRRAREERKPLGALISELVAEALARRGAEAPSPPFHWHTRRMGTFVDLEDKNAVEWALGQK
jgi:predicted AAA+ superfamily ATPase